VASPHRSRYHEIMNYDHDNKESRPKRVREPVQVYLDAPEQERLERLTQEMATTKSDVLRQGLEALERELFDPERHPALQIIGIAGVGQGRARDVELEGKNIETDVEVDIDVARDHDRYLAALEDRRLADKGSSGA
jgi:Arc/MetJ-type ribon-helix-helix transcriptional regulator